jgi:lipid-A-disaccharide synthase-like uncharacterized protein
VNPLLFASGSPPEIPPLWLAIGFIGQAVFTGRFVVQWIASERQGRSVVPEAFWWMSISGSWLVLAYAIHRQDPVFILAQTFGTVVYGRNLMMIYRKKSATGAPTSDDRHDSGDSVRTADSSESRPALTNTGSNTETSPTIPFKASARTAATGDDSASTIYPVPKIRAS